MTTRVTIKHEGPEHHNVQVRVLDGEQVARVCEVRPGETSSGIHVYKGRTIEISESPAPNGGPTPAT